MSESEPGSTSDTEMRKVVKSWLLCKINGKCFQPNPFIFLAKLPWIFFFISGKGCQMVFNLTSLSGDVIIHDGSEA
ncbi:hypothetical protein BK139_08390 [Paenibacillus sp. FSL R5-0490]|nr:hypothetical protein BK139_08390 [Paenibacillus sp. FSL R5-0490]